MPTTTIRLPEELKARVAAAAARAGMTLNAFILQAIAERTEAEERRSDFRQDAEARYGRIAESGRTVGWREMRSYLVQRIAGKKVRRPASKRSAR